MGKQVWVGEHLYNLLNHSVKELQQIYPAYNRNTLKGKKSYWTKQLREGKITMPPAPNSGEREPIPNEDILAQHGLTAPDGATISYHIGYIKNSEGEIEYTKPLPSVHPAQLSRPSIDFPQATPARITPSRRKPVDRDYKSLFIFSDMQVDYRRLEDNTLVPVHDERAMEVARLLCRDIQPDLIINLGDTIDLASLSRFKPDSDHFQRTLGPSFQRIHDYYAQLRADNPNARIIEKDSNHNTRLKDFMLKNAPQMYGVKQAGADDEEFPVFTYPYLANLRHVDVEWTGGYGADTFYYGEEYGKPPIAFRHGTENSQNGTTASKIMKNNIETHAVQGHDHTDQHCCRTNRAGQYLQYHVVPALCRTTGEVPSYHSAVDDRNQVVHYQENWQQGLLLIRDYDGDYEFESVQIHQGKINYHGRTYDGNL